jgi:outer membrane protein assembly factor BamA
MLPRLALALVLLHSLQAQSLPLESVILEGTGVSRDAVLAIADLRIGALINKAAIDAACGKLQDTGLFQSISYRYAPGPKRGYVLTLTIEDQKQLTDAVIDFPFVDDDELWQWLASQYPPFNRKVPGNDAAQEFLSRRLAEHAKAELEGQPVVTRMETDLAHHKVLISFQPATLPRIYSMNFTGQHELTSDALGELLSKVVPADEGYTERHFREIVEINLRRAYEEHGMYRVKFPAITPQKAAAGSVTVTTVIEEGPQYKLGDVTFVGDNLPVEAMLKAAKFKKGQTANWTEIQQGIREAEKPVKRTGYFTAAAHPERVFHDGQLVLDLRIPFTLGPMYRSGALKIIGLTPEEEAKARKLWKLHPGDPFDYAYADEFLKTFAQSVAPGQFKKFSSAAQKQADNVMDFTLLFEPR